MIQNDVLERVLARLGKQFACIGEKLAGTNPANIPCCINLTVRSLQQLLDADASHHQARDITRHGLALLRHHCMHGAAAPPVR